MVSSPRIAPLEPPYSADLEASFGIVMPEGVPPLNIFRTVAHNPRVLGRMVRGGLLDRGSISLVDRELVILRACARCGAEYEWGVHAAAFADAACLSAEQLADTCRPRIDPALWTDTQRLLLAMVDALHEVANIDDNLWSSLSAQFADDQLIELIMLAGLYHAVSFLVNALGVENEAFAPVFPDLS